MSFGDAANASVGAINKRDALLPNPVRQPLLGERRHHFSNTVEDLLPVLACSVRVMNFQQVARTWYSDVSEPTARRRLERLEKHGLIVSHRGMAHPELEISEPVVSWSPGQAGPDPEAVSYALQVRWTRPLIRQTVYTASAQSVRIFGGPLRRARHGLQALQLTHDLMVSAVFLLFREKRPELAKGWISEDYLPAVKGAKVPDALVRTARGELVFIEFGGSYRSDRVKKLHSHCATKGLSYELW